LKVLITTATSGGSAGTAVEESGSPGSALTVERPNTRRAYADSVPRLSCCLAQQKLCRRQKNGKSFPL
jgi:hypothetical protein